MMAMTAHRPIRSSSTPARTQDKHWRRAARTMPAAVPEAPTARFIAAAAAAFGRGEIDAALDAIWAGLAADPDWTDGYRTAAELLWQYRSPHAFEQWLTRIVHDADGQLTAASTCLRLLSDAGCHVAVRDLIPHVRLWAGDHLFFTLLEAVATSETGDPDAANALFARAEREGGQLSLPYVRHLIKSNDPAAAAAQAEAFLAQQPDSQTGWALLGTAWRMTGDPRHGWLVDRPGMIRTIDMDVADDALDALAARLRTLHGARTQPFDQSLRGGTQTAGRLLERDEPEIAALRMGFMAALHHYVAALPPEDMRHPLLSRRRESFYMTDSWSVRLVDGGYHVSHIHPAGSLSAAFYVALPPADPAHPKAGWLTIGAPPEDLRTGLAPLHIIEPRRARLAIFPSFLWHGTMPFPQGERISVAFDTLMDI
jgi:hypothetical protein